MAAPTLLSIDGSLIVAIVSYLEPQSILNFEVCSIHSMDCVSSAAETLLKSTLNSIDMRSTRYTRLSYLQYIMQNTSQTCSLSGKRNWGVASRLNQIGHEASQRLHEGLGGVKLRHNNQNSIVSIPQHSDHSKGFAFSKFIMARGLHQIKFQFGGNGNQSFGITRPLSYDTNSNIPHRPSRHHCVLEPYIRKCYPGGPGGWQHKGLINTALFGYVPSSLLVGRGVHGDSYEELVIPMALRDSVLTLELDMGEEGTDGKLKLYCGDNHIHELIGGLRGGYVWIAQLGPACNNACPTMTVGPRLLGS